MNGSNERAARKGMLAGENNGMWRVTEFWRYLGDGINPH